VNNAESVSKASVHDFPVTPDMHLRLAVRAYQTGDINAALENARCSLDAGEGHANSLLGAICEKGPIGIRDYSKALSHYEQGIKDAGSLECWLGVARLNYLGLGLEQNLVKAFECYKVVAEDAGHPVAHLMLGKMYLDGEGVGRDLSHAEKHLQLAGENKQVFAYSYLGSLYFRSGRYLTGTLYRVIGTFYAVKISFTGKERNCLRRI
jgi:TPR repeat protein